MKEKQWCKKHSRTYYDNCPECMRELAIKDIEELKVKGIRKLVESTEDKKPPFTKIQETDDWKKYICPDCHEPTLYYIKPKGRQKNGKWECYYPFCPGDWCRKYG